MKLILKVTQEQNDFFAIDRVRSSLAHLTGTLYLRNLKAKEMAGSNTAMVNNYSGLISKVFEVTIEIDVYDQNADLAQLKKAILSTIQMDSHLELISINGFESKSHLHLNQPALEPLVSNSNNRLPSYPSTSASPSLVNINGPLLFNSFSNLQIEAEGLVKLKVAAANYAKNFPEYLLFSEAVKIKNVNAALRFACAKGNLLLVKLLCKYEKTGNYNLNTAIKGPDDMDAHQLAKQSGNDKLKRFIEENIQHTPQGNLLKH